MRFRVVVIALAGAVVLSVACNGSSSGPACAYIDASALVPETSTCMTLPSYATDVAPILDRACNSTCHAPGVGPWPLNNHDDVYDWASIIGDDLETCTMPPADAGAGNGTLTTAERTMVLDWIACGAPNN